MKTKTINLYTVDELKEQFPEVYQKVIERNRLINVDDSSWYEYPFETLTEELTKNGFLDAEIWFSGFSSQGDGACFDAKIDIDFFLREERFRHLRKVKRWIEAEIKKTASANYYSHEKTRYVDLYLDANGKEGKRTCALIEELAKTVEESRLDFSRKIYRALEEIYFADITDEAVEDTLIANDYEFYADGRFCMEG